MVYGWLRSEYLNVELIPLHGYEADAQLPRLKVRFHLPPCDRIDPSVDNAVDHEVRLARLCSGSTVFSGPLGEPWFRWVHFG
jgi:hypothetical protein